MSNLSLPTRPKQQRDKQQKDNRLIKLATNKMKDGGISKLIAPDAQGDRVGCCTRADIERVRLPENKQRFYQASNTPFVQPPLLDLVSPLGIGPGAESILAGTFEPPEGTDPYACKLIEMLAVPSAIRDAHPVDVSSNVHNFQKG